MNSPLNEIKRECKARLPMPRLLHELGMGDYAKASCRSPFRPDKSPSWGIFNRESNWFFKDQATGETGDEFTFLALLRGLDCRTQFPKVLEEYARLAGVSSEVSPAVTVKPVKQAFKPDRTGFARGTRDQLKALAASRGIGLPGIELASERSLLVFGQKFGFECWGLTDCSGRALEIRRLDGKMFPAGGNLQERKSHAVKGSQKAWPIGILEAQAFPKIALVEGMPDFLEAHYLALWEGKPDVVPVAILSASPSIHSDALRYFRGKRIRIFPHAESAGVKGAAKWFDQLRSVGAEVDLFDFTGLRMRDGRTCNDLLDFNDLDPQEHIKDPSLWRVLP